MAWSFYGTEGTLFVIARLHDLPLDLVHDGWETFGSTPWKRATVRLNISPMWRTFWSAFVQEEAHGDIETTHRATSACILETYRTSWPEVALGSNKEQFVATRQPTRCLPRNIETLESGFEPRSKHRWNAEWGVCPFPKGREWPATGAFTSLSADEVGEGLLARAQQLPQM